MWSGKAGAVKQERKCPAWRHVAKSDLPLRRGERWAVWPGSRPWVYEGGDFSKVIFSLRPQCLGGENFILDKNEGNWSESLPHSTVKSTVSDPTPLMILSSFTPGVRRLGTTKSISLSPVLGSIVQFKTLQVFPPKLTLPFFVPKKFPLMVEPAPWAPWEGLPLLFYFLNLKELLNKTRRTNFRTGWI